MALELAEAYVSLKLELSALQKDLAQVRSSLDKTFDDIEKRAKTAGTAAIAAFSGAVAAGSTLLARSFIKAAVSMDTMKRSLTAVSGSAAEAERQLKELREVAKLPGLGLQEAVAGATNLQAVGIEAGKSKDILMAFGNALASVGRGRQELDGVLLGLTQMVSVGKILGQDLRQITSRVPQLRKVLKDAFGTASTEEIQKMGVSVEQVVDVMVAGLNKLPKVTGGARNAMENLNDSVFQLKVALGDVLLPTFAKIVDKLASVVEWMNKLSDTQKSALAWGTVITGAIAGITSIAGGLIIALPRVISGINLLSTAFTGLGVAIGTTSAILAAAGTVIWATKRIYDALTKSIDNVTVALKEGERIGIMQKHAFSYLNTAAKELADKGLDPAKVKIADTSANIRRLSKLIFDSTDEFYRNKIAIMTVADAMDLLKRRAGKLNEVFGPPTPELEPIDPGTIHAIKGISDLLEAQSRLRMALIGTISDQYEQEAKAAQETYRLTKQLAEQKIKDIQAEVAAKKMTETDGANAIKAINIELLAAYQEYLNKRTEIEKKHGEDLKQKEADLVKDKKEKEEEKIALFKKSLAEQYRFAIASFDEMMALSNRQYQEEKALRDKSREDAIKSAKATRKGIEEVWKGFNDLSLPGAKSKDVTGLKPLKRANVQTSTDLPESLIKWQEYYATLTELDKKHYEALHGHVENWSLLSIEELKKVKTAWDDADKNIKEGFIKAIIEMSEATINWKETFKELIGGVTEAITGMFIDSFDNTRDAMKAMINDIKKLFSDMLKSLIKQLLTSAIGKLLLNVVLPGYGGIASAGLGYFGFASGGIAKGGLQIPKLASGGIYNKPTLAMIGEGSSDEAVIPLKGGKVPVELTGSSGLSIQTLNINLPYADLSRVSHQEVKLFMERKIIPALQEAKLAGFAV